MEPVSPSLRPRLAGRADVGGPQTRRSPGRRSLRTVRRNYVELLPVNVESGSDFKIGDAGDSEEEVPALQ